MLSRSRHRVSRKSAFKHDPIADSESRRSEKYVRQVYPECRGSGGVGRGIERECIASRVASKADGLILNFCTPGHASRVIAALGNRTGEPRIACYLKLFYASKSNDAARRLLVQEFLNYDSIPHYHQMFLQDRTAGSIALFRQSNDWKDHEFELPDQLLKVSLANPSDGELAAYVRSFEEAGVDLPVIYPYFPEDERQGFKLQTVSRICNSA